MFDVAVLPSLVDIRQILSMREGLSAHGGRQIVPRLLAEASIGRGRLFLCWQ